MSEDDIRDMIEEYWEEISNIDTDTIAESRTCAYCGDEVPVEDIMQNPEIGATWDARVGEFEGGEYQGKADRYHRYWYCSEACEEDAKAELWEQSKEGEDVEDPHVVEPEIVELGEEDYPMQFT